jgi:hypothetical protein
MATFARKQKKIRRGNRHEGNNRRNGSVSSPSCPWLLGFKAGHSPSLHEARQSSNYQPSERSEAIHLLSFLERFFPASRVSVDGLLSIDIVMITLTNLYCIMAGVA